MDLLTFQPGESSNLLIWSGAESTTTIVGASIPFLRVLVKEAKSTGNSYNLKDMTGKRGTGNASRIGRPNEKMYNRHQDDRSDRSILGDEPGKLTGAIVQTSELSVSYHERTDEENQKSAVKASVF